MASSVNNIAATFSTFPKKPSSSSSSKSSSSPPKKLPLSISTSWNPHAAIPKSRRLSLIGLYGPAGPPRSASAAPVSAVRSPRQTTTETGIGKSVPGVALSYLDGNDAVRTVGLAGLCRGKRVAIVGAAAAFSPACGRFVKAVEEGRAGTRRRGWDLVACVAANDVFVMRAWGRYLAVGDNVAMLSDGGGQLTAAIGACLGVGPLSGRFCVSAVNGVITGVDFDDDC